MRAAGVVRGDRFVFLFGGKSCRRGGGAISRLGWSGFWNDADFP